MRSSENAKNTESTVEIDSEKTTETVTSPEVLEVAPRQALIYCGPSLPKGILTQYMTYRGGYPKHLESHIAKCPAVGRLFVTPDKLTGTIDAINKAGTAENVWKNEVLDYIKGGIK